MHELLRLLRALRSAPSDPAQAFAHRMRIGLAVALIILLFSLVR